MMRRYVQATAGVVFAAMVCAGGTASGQTAPSLGSAQSFAVLGGSTVTNTGTSVITGNLGVSPGAAVTGFPPGLVSGTIHAADAVALAAQTSVTTAYNSLVSQPCTQDLTGLDLGGRTLTPGVYCFSTSAGLTGTVVLDAQNNPNAVFIFKIGSTLTTAAGSVVAMINGASLCNVFWQVGSSATLGTTTNFSGNILALTSITLTTGARISGRALARNGAVTLDTNVITRSTCAAACPVLSISPLTVPAAGLGVPYSLAFTAAGGTLPFVFTATGALPPGLTVTPAGLFAGTPTAEGSFTFTVSATDANGCFVQQTYTTVVAVGVPTLPQMFVVFLALGLAALGYLRLRRSATQ